MAFFPTGQNSSEYLGMERLDPPIQNTRIGGEVLYPVHRNPQIFQKTLGPAGGKNLYPQPIELTGDGFQSLFGKYGNQCGLYFDVFHRLDVLGASKKALQK